MLFKENLSYPLKDFKLLSFVVAIALYAVWGSPTPDFPGAIEFLIAVLLFLSIGGVVGLTKIFSLYKEKQPFFILSAAALFLYGLVVPTIQALIYNYDAVVVLRDLVGFIFLCLPIFFVQFFHDKFN